MRRLGMWMSSHRSIVALVLWLAVVVAGFGTFERYKAAPGRQESAPFVVEDIRTLAGAAPSWKLLMFVHPHCPCSKASLAELQKVVSTFPESVRAEVVVVKPDRVTSGWVHGVCAAAAAKIPGVNVRCDHGGLLADHYGAHTSGHVVLYDPEGKLHFCGGMTRLRGHAGDNVGSRSIVALLSGQSPEAATTPVFGCPLLGANDHRITQKISGSNPAGR